MSRLLINLVNTLMNDLMINRSRGRLEVMKPHEQPHERLVIKESLGFVHEVKRSRAHAEVVLFINKQQPVTSSSFYYMRVAGDLLSRPKHFIAKGFRWKFGASK